MPSFFPNGKKKKLRTVNTRKAIDMKSIHTLAVYIGFRKWSNAKFWELAFFESTEKGVGKQTYFN